MTPKHLKKPDRRGPSSNRAGVLRPVVPAVVCFCLITTLAWLLPLRPTVSAREKRNLEPFPKFSVSSLFSGDYLESIGVWLSDTFTGRDAWIDASQSLQQLYGINDVVIYGDVDAGDAIPAVTESTLPAAESTPTAVGLSEATDKESVLSENEEAAAAAEQMEEKPAEPESPEEITWGGENVENDELISIGAVIQIDDSVYSFTSFSQGRCDQYAETLSKAAELLQDKARVFNVLVLHGTTVMLPRDYRDSIGCAPEEEILNYVNSKTAENVIDVDTFTPLVTHNDEYVYFHADHHWTQRGAYYAYRDWAEKAGFEPVELDALEENVQTGFRGSLYYQAERRSRLKMDDVYTYTPTGDVHLYIQTGGPDSTDYRGYEEALYPQIVGEDKYMAFLTGDFPLCTLVNNSVSDGSACLLVKNSNGNPLSYLLTEHYQYVYVMDYRKYQYRTLTDFVDYYDVDDVVFCLSTGQAQAATAIGMLNDLVK